SSPLISLLSNSLMEKTLLKVLACSKKRIKSSSPSLTYVEIFDSPDECPRIRLLLLSDPLPLVPKRINRLLMPDSFVWNNLRNSIVV
ncbi:hypothetical protein HAX54_013930, partial [Datura stramonium]|nr:hypothetical protein [Datura stramonium]